MTNATDKTLELTPHEFAHLGDGALAYVKAINSEDVKRLFPEAPAFARACNSSPFSAPTARRSC